MDRKEFLDTCIMITVFSVSCIVVLIGIAFIWGLL